MGVNKLDLSAEADIPLDHVLVENEAERAQSDKDASHADSDAHEQELSQDETLQRLPDLKVVSNDSSIHSTAVGNVASSLLSSTQADSITNKDNNANQCLINFIYYYYYYYLKNK
ncbi:hypothetical protein RFI_11190 [Reticulomyxa filosa]|uniref:Uncharacterized protein n=1 Tax=Reticulomyxa filosa TaxID=46433 RepID=X6NI14_RETFI|nr:hypothetical protein RFI_11190 [Reticulomyxa filosa]|eukprot:ETO25945.1 hypothetical protein RFI_11190 [Reticulomyxa filosa]